ncbi:hypothetical protein [Streptomyces avermitilis]|uniref:SLAC1 family transporter n=1 Tax=Streptomyces avermitilis TaxID=33903 RepID=UPI003F54019D
MLTGALRTTALHPGYLLPVSSAPFIASATASTFGLRVIGDAAFAIGLPYRPAFGTIILGRRAATGQLPQPAWPALTVLTIPPATGGITWTAAHRGVFDAVGHGFAGILLFALLLVVFLLPELRQPSFHLGRWVFSFPAAVSTNFALRLLNAPHTAAKPVLTWRSWPWPEQCSPCSRWRPCLTLSVAPRPGRKSGSPGGAPGPGSRPPPGRPACGTGNCGLSARIGGVPWRPISSHLGAAASHRSSRRRWAGGLSGGRTGRLSTGRLLYGESAKTPNRTTPGESP